ncbi:hypothetical protein HETIRDRAFT_449133 [Heterobasidion irregulare TC 32-1]|uniref:Uncharacterized protein n=1 Tax=Heterobasidion irregulare (strain TC 32-1) TaxID=747525 RepID=W4KKN8_HETIT|nr:uncharacterized protein HETIRDRAFT_449133 [Heterobasidion irregulare TC 32-1]ETW86269.1 hypothetical protein HETIRDRAFT_449133 [Heterobasidion irregulare TC 32-1]
MSSVRPPYPSFTLVMSSNMSTMSNPADTSRLPAYRASHLGRFHPYPRAHPSYHENYMSFPSSAFVCDAQTTVDYRYGDPPIFQPQPRSSFALPAIIIEDCDIKIDSDSGDTDTAVDRRNRLNLKTFSHYVLAFAVAVQRKCRRTAVVKKMGDEPRLDLLD